MKKQLWFESFTEEYMEGLPALPTAWPTGCVNRFRAQDGVLVSFSWEAGKLTSFTLTSPEDRTLRVLSDGREWTVALKAGQPKTVAGERRPPST